MGHTWLRVRVPWVGSRATLAPGMPTTCPGRLSLVAGAGLAGE